MSVDKHPRYDTVRFRRLQELSVKRLANQTRFPAFPFTESDEEAGIQRIVSECNITGL
jgi:hypothetical protein